ncbi:bifunctional acetate--CoA ligase family protein/GNAT family N-acetyltransferase [Microcoleus sp. FACHB-672]|uniref:bifunctional acetate--CoA ligase family protein/GNAT family N-acetyltransferase n=1 Tax=Microcoleus sp. FACHB-672 TaxID=2692825 RepID=UPI001687DE5A|nr:bifunctional acetate--CoA ligase family protein/GNAT family N-acetyltransferase [Microcoleus sp. FACHB-672]MBD2039991.1 bifunctional acetate--CoA ligase family protein/GNAT family N-acetyltransferase [Microcoleus sp. FACHB-672]
MPTPIKPTTDFAHDVLRYERQPLDAIFAPQTVAVIGATEKPGSVGRTILWNLIGNPFGGTVFPVNPKRHSVLGIKAYPTIADVPEAVDLAVVVTPAPTVPGVIKECVDAGVKGAIIVSAGFREIGPKGIELEQQILKEARRGRMRIIGPNCLGVMSPLTGLNATFASVMARPGNVGFISQSGALCTAILDWSFRENVGFSAFMSIGSMLDVGWGDLIYYLGDDLRTQSIVIYMESIGDARAFLSAAREVALTKPIIVIKSGRTDAAAKAAASHTGALAGSDEVLDAAFRRSGVLRVNTIDDLFNMAEVLAKQPRPKGKRLTILTNAGGPGVLATDALIGEGGELAQLSPETITALNEFLPTHWSHGNPIDILGDAEPERYAKAIAIAAKDPNSDGLLTILTPQAMSDPTQTAEQLKLVTPELNGKPILASWMGGADVAAGEAILNRANIFTLPYPDSAAHIFNYMWRYTYNLRGLYETPEISRDCGENACDLQTADNIIHNARKAGRTILTEYESKQLLAAYGIPTVDTRIAKSEDEAVQLAEEIGYPVVLKLYSETITHKTDVGGVRLLLQDEETVRGAYGGIQSSVTEKVGAEHFHGVTVQPMLKLEGYEIIIGSSLDSQFGPVLLFGTGGQLVEVFKDRALALPPLNTTLARRMMEQTKIYTALKGVRGRKPVDLAALEQLMVRFSQLVVEQPWIKEIDINPLLATPHDPHANGSGLIALDARVVLHDPQLTEDQLPLPAIRPYPTQYVAPWTMKDGMPVIIRPIRPEDEPLVVKFHETLSDRSVYFRYFHLLKLSRRVSHERLTRICFIDYDREMALVAEYTNPQTGESEILGFGRLSKLHGANEAEFGLLVSDKYQHRGLGTELLSRLLQVGRDENLSRICADILPENLEMQRVSEKLGLRLNRSVDVVKAEIDL